MSYMTRTHAKRLLHLADVLDDLPRKDFDICNFMRPSKKSLCGSAGCALGWATTIPEFRRAGLKLVDYLPVFIPTSPAEAARCDQRCQETWKEPAPPAFQGYAAGTFFFGLTHEEVDSVFDPNGYPEVFETDSNRTVTPKMAAKKIRAVVKKHHPELARARKQTKTAA